MVLRRAVRPVLAALALAALAVPGAAAATPAPTPTADPPAAAAEAPPGGALNGTRLMDGVALYPRAVRLAHSGAANGTIVASVVTFDGDVGHGAIFTSTDDGRTFERTGTVSDPGATKGLCCSTLYELPRQVGDLAAGTLLWSASVGQQEDESTRRMTLPVWASADQGRTWEHVSTAATAPGGKGLWEPELAVTPDGRLALYVSDENQQPAHSQTLVQTTSPDGRTWGPLENVVAAQNPDLRPGMPVVRTLPDGTYLMSYEVCGPVEDCRHYTRRSPDGTSWGDPAVLGHPVTTADGVHFRHTPNISWYDDGTPDGRLLAVGQMLYGADGNVLPGSGATLLANDAAPESPWAAAPAPVGILDPWNDYCPNYSPTLLALPERGEVLELSTGYEAEGGACTTYFAVADLPD
ncbi:sialidase family protein [Promicromonospora thailandica]|uniref:BNR repeat-like domain-containing protein n=1 Tax=Promicromonospora thailandica TaxID=765201 RepID=A0A9X2G9S6_9MICO|nr:sialidase family protein [Promicromonospora thailandica]MCP2265764.1 BNR repeat-like domain-containing protein [Promicromonospora thailandica]